MIGTETTAMEVCSGGVRIGSILRTSLPQDFTGKWEFIAKGEGGSVDEELLRRKSGIRGILPYPEQKPRWSDITWGDGGR